MIKKALTLSNIIAAIIVLLASIVFWAGWAELDFPYFDDAYMYARYANNILNGYGFAWNPGEPAAYGGTSMALSLLVTAVKGAFPFLTYERVLLLCSGLPGYFNYFLLAAFLCHAFRMGRKRFLPVLAGCMFYLTICTPFVFHSQTGMGTQLAFMSNLLLLFVLCIWHRKGGNLWALMATFAAYFTFAVRPDNGLYATLMPALFLLLLWLPNKANSPISIKHVLLFCLSFVLVMGADSLAKLLVFGDLLPLPFYAKKSGYFEGYLGADGWNSMRYFWQFLRFSAPFLLLIILGFSLKAHAKMLTVVLLPAFATATYFFGVVPIMGHQARYLFPALPFVIFGALYCSSSLLSSIKNGGTTFPDWLKKYRFRLLGCIGLIAALWLLPEPVSEFYASRVLNSSKAYDIKELYGTKKSFPQDHADWWEGTLAFSGLCKQLPKGSTVTASEHGYLAAKNPNINIVDLIALHDKHLAHNGFSAEYVINERQPAVIWLAHYNYTKINYDLLSHPDFARQYLFIPELFSYGVAVRKDSHAAKNALAKSLKTLYGIDEWERYTAEF